MLDMGSDGVPMRVLQRVTLNDGSEVPVLAFGTGTAQAFGDTSNVVQRALDKDLVHLDCAWWYKNQSFTAQGIKASGKKREEIYLSSKGGDFHGDPENFDARGFLEVCLRDLDVPHVDMFLLHADILVPEDVMKPWKQMEQIKREGLAKSIGVSNFSSKSLQIILNHCEIKPAVNQAEFHPYSRPHYMPSLLPLCEANDIKIESFGPLVPLIRHTGGPVDEAVQSVLRERDVKGETEGQILLMWNRQVTNGIVITTTTKDYRMEEQAAPFWTTTTIPPLSSQHIDRITAAGESAPYRHWGTHWPYLMQGEGGHQACPVGSTHRKRPEDPLAHLRTVRSMSSGT
ncbi:NADP-dependent oxidoreductase domain-containing protein [Kockovaella imperatae]|uniref:NADP-dependent oxidoreductase domain-containing protein n=1 Tax=Kockovaella imperatae TaxID=4999 RepID=A0A1Y1ULJ1_9TREE|nr:NADP-dependent oxidoreductase domain-containing protein [Kockovaella imperatae]ORX37985.1 NADP-dependent oxidoreductase domain-containing protein [Kockovaella imperatae]